MFPLTDKEKQVLELRKNGKTLKEVGQEFGVTPERIRQIEAKAQEKERQNLSHKWKTKDGELLDIKDMETSHILNCLNLLERKARYIKNALTYGAPESAWDEIDGTDQLEMRIALDAYKKRISVFKRELDKRK